MKFDNIDFDIEIDNHNKTKNVVLERLLKDKIITQEQYDEYSINWNILLVKRNWFKKLCDLFKIDDREGYSIIYTRFDL